MQNPVLALNLTTLDRVLIRQTPREQRLYGAWEDWCYFLAYKEGGRIEVANTIGYTCIHTWDQVESIEKREPFRVRALTERSFLAALRTDYGRRGEYVPEYATAEVLMGRQNLRGHLDGFHIRFADGKQYTNASGATIHDEDMHRLRSTVSRSVMPVSTSKRGKSAEARGQARLDERRAQKVVKQFLSAALSGKRASTDQDLGRI